MSFHRKKKPSDRKQHSHNSRRRKQHDVIIHPVRKLDKVHILGIYVDIMLAADRKRLRKRRFQPVLDRFPVKLKPQDMVVFILLYLVYVLKAVL